MRTDDLGCDDDEWIGLTCKVCGAGYEWIECWLCHGTGGFHDCGEDCCPCLDKEEITELCYECHGEGGYHECPNVPDEKVATEATGAPAS